MKELNSMARVTGMLQKLFRALNEKFYDGKLPTPIITVSPTPGAYGHFTAYDAWEDVKGNKFYEINISASDLTYETESNSGKGIQRDMVQVTGTLLHEMAHLYDYVELYPKTGKLDVSRVKGKTAYHNTIFKKTAETHGLTVEHDLNYGWTITQLNDEALEWLMEQTEFREIQINRIEYGTAGKPKAKPVPPKTASKSNSIRYQCPNCKAIARATKEIKLICGDCMVEMPRTN